MTTPWISFLQGFLYALRNYSNHHFLFERLNKQQEEVVTKNKLTPATKEQVTTLFKIWLLNSTADFFYGDQWINYTPILDLGHWQQLPHYQKQEAFVEAKIGQFFDILEIDFFTQKTYSFYQSPLGGHAVISDSILIEHENAWYIFSMGWDD
jgi:hypothetical protein